MKKRVEAIGAKVVELFNHTLIHIDDMSIDVLNTFPQCYKEYREKVLKDMHVRGIIVSYECIDKPAPLNAELITDEDIINVWKRDVWQTHDFVDNLFVEK